MTKVPFNYEYFKANPKTKLVTRDDYDVYFVGEREYDSSNYPLVFEEKEGFFTTTLEGWHLGCNIKDDRDVFMIVESNQFNF